MKRRSRLSPVVAGALCALLLPSVFRLDGIREVRWDLPGQLPEPEPAVVRPHRPGARLFARELDAAGHGLCRLMRYRDEPPPAGYRARRRTSRPPSRRSRADQPDLHLPAADGLPLQRRPSRPSRRLRAGDLPHHGAGASTPPAYLYTPGRSSAPRTSTPAGRRGRQGSTARGNTLIIRFSRAVGNFAAWTTMPFFCAVPPTLPPRPEGVRSFPAAGPYTIREYRPNERVIVRRNRLLRRHPDPPRRRLRHRPQRRLTRRSARPHPSRQSRLGLHHAGCRLRARPGR